MKIFYVFAMSLLEVAIRWLGSGSGSDGSDRISLIKKLSGRVRVNLIQVVSDFELNIVGFFHISGHFGSGFGFLVAHVIFGFESFGSESGFRSSDI
jgi:hypothetical protein